MVKVAITACLATTLWMMPSVGTRGQGTLGDRFTHADRRLVDDTVAGRAVLRRADDQLARSITGL